MFMTSNFTVVSNSFCELVHFENRDRKTYLNSTMVFVNGV